MNKEITLGSLFDGSGGFPLAAKICGIKPLWASEIEPFPIRVTTKRMPEVAHLGDISLIDGAKIKPVDIITFGSPCQDLSIAGKRDGLDGSKSSLFYEAIRVIKEMRKETGGEYPKYVIWENVPGAFSSNNGEDFKTVLEEITKIKNENIHVPKPRKWQTAGSIVGDGYSICWRVLDAKHFGVPQRRRRIFLVANFTSNSGSEILFEPESMRGDIRAGEETWQKTTRSFRKSLNTTSIPVLNDQGGQRMDVTTGYTATLRARAGNPPFVFENHAQDLRFTGPLKVSATLGANLGTGGNNQPLVVDKPAEAFFDVRFTSGGTKNVRANVYQTDIARTVDTGGNVPDSNQGGVAVVSLQGSMIGREPKNGPKGSGINMVECFTLNATDRHGVCYSTSKNTHHTVASMEETSTLVSSDYKDPPTVSRPYVVRRLTPFECGRLQGFPDDWCDGLETEDPTYKDLKFWRGVFETHRKIVTGARKPKTDKQIISWLKNPYTDSAIYKMWGNGVALPCVVFVLMSIKKYQEYVDK